MQINDDKNTRKFHIGVVGGGSWGTALANLLASKGYPIKLWVFEKGGQGSNKNDPIFALLFGGI